MQLRNHDVTAHFLLWSERIRQGLRSIKEKTSQIDEDLFSNHLASIYHNHSREDIKSAIKTVLHPQSNLKNWYSEYLSRAGVSVHFVNAAPRIHQFDFTKWRAAATRIDADALLTLEFVKRFNRHPKAEDLNLWGVYAVSDDPDLDRVFARGVSDTHVHLEGCRAIPLLWLHLVQGKIRLNKIPMYRRLFKEDADRYSQSLRSLKDEYEAIGQAIEARSKLSNRLISNYQEWRNSVAFPSPVSQDLWEERHLLGCAWISLHKHYDDELAEHLDIYLYGKNLFLARHVQAPWGNVGLSEFKSYFQRAKLIESHESKRVQWLQQQRMTHFVVESPRLRHIEFRISPFETASEYARFFKYWDQFYDGDEYLSRRNIKVSFVVHFIRQTFSDEKESEVIPFSKLRALLDKQSAALHLFRQQYPLYAKKLVGLDVANLEKTCPPHIFTPYIRLLRGDPLHKEGVGHGLPDSPFIQCWHRLDQRSLLLPPPSFPKLGLTFHAGEDYFHPLDGMRTMISAIEGLDMKAGDRIGHGLAAGRSIRHFIMKYGDSLNIPRGDALDNMVWLYGQIIHNPSGFENQIVHLGESIELLSEEIYERVVTPKQMLRVLKLRHNVPVFLSEETRKRDLAREIRHNELYNQDVRKKRHEMILNPDIFMNMGDLINYTQGSLIENIARRGIVIELNPSSNFITGGLETLAHHPFFSYKKHLKEKKLELRATINCDDPGTFATRIENEYSCMLNALLGRDFSRDEALQVLDAMRITAEESCFAGSGDQFCNCSR